MDGSRAAPEDETPPPIGRVLQASSFYLLGNVASRVVGFLAIPFYARFLNPAQYGLIELVELSTQTIAIALGLQAVGAALSRLFYDQPTREREQSVVSTSLIATAVLSALVMVLAVAGAGQLSQLVFHTDAWTGLLRAAFVAMFFSNMTEVVLVYERIRNNARFFLAYTLITLSANLALNILFIGVLDYGVWGFVSSKLVVTAVGSLYLMLRMRRDVGWHWRSLYVPELVRFGAPLILSSLSYFAIHFSDRFFLSASVSLAELGRYALAYKFAILVSALVGDSFAKSWEATLYRYTTQDGWRAQFARIASYFTFLLFATGLGIALFSPELLRIMVPEAYFPPPLLLPILIASYLAREIGDFFRSLLLINKRSGRVGQIAFAGALLNVAANMALIPSYGIYGAAVATFLTWFIYMLACWIVANREHRLPVRVRSYVRIALWVLIVYGLADKTRVPSLFPQILMDVVWLTVFMTVALGLFFSAEERRGALGLAGSVGLWAFTRTTASRDRSVPPAPGAERRLLMLSYYYPPQGEIGGARPHRFARWLSRAGVGVTVVTSAPHSPEVVQDGQPKLVHAPSPRFSQGAAANLSTVHGSGRVVRAATAILHLGERLAMPYDDRLGWLPEAYAAAARHITPGTVVLSSHPPTVTHLTALALKHRHGMPWIADFRDPLWGNPYRTSQRAAWIDPVVERLTVEHADAVIANTDAAADMLRARYPAFEHKLHVIWNGYDPDEPMEPAPLARRDKRVLAHIGTLYGDRTLLPVLMSLARLVECGAVEAGSIEVRQIGRADPSCLEQASVVKDKLASCGVAQLVRPSLPKAAAREEMQGADWLMLLDMNVVNPGLQVPAKLFEYIQTGRPILALTVPGSSVERVLAMSGVTHACLDLNAPPAAFDAALLAFLSGPTAASYASDAFRTEFAAPGQVRHLLEIISRIEAAALAS